MVNYKTNLAQAYAGLPVWSKKPSKLHLKMIRYLQRSVKGKSEYISSMKALNNWREKMSLDYNQAHGSNGWMNPPAVLLTGDS